jgi:hypothetical protein
MLSGFYRNGMSKLIEMNHIVVGTMILASALPLRPGKRS